MQIVIDIPKEDYNKIKDNSPDAFNYLASWRLYDAIKNGTPIHILDAPSIDEPTKESE